MAPPASPSVPRVTGPRLLPSASVTANRSAGVSSRSLRGRPPTGDSTTHLRAYHDHETGVVRGLRCGFPAPLPPLGPDREIRGTGLVAGMLVDGEHEGRLNE